MFGSGVCFLLLTFRGVFGETGRGTGAYEGGLGRRELPGKLLLRPLSLLEGYVSGDFLKTTM